MWRRQLPRLPSIGLVLLSAACAGPTARETLEDHLGHPVPDDQVQETVIFTLASGEKVEMTREQGRWRVVEPAPQSDFALDTPQSALAAFFHGVEAEDWSLLRRLIPEQEQGRFADDRALKARIDSAMEAMGREMSDIHPTIAGNEATITYAPHRTVKLVLEGGTWRIVDLE